MHGQELRILIDEKQTAGKHSVTWNGKDNLGMQVGSGIYFYQIKLENRYSQIKKMILLKNHKNY